MLYEILRYVIFLGILVVCVILIQKSGIRKKKVVTAIVVLLVILLASLSFLFPVENLVLSFDSPESAFLYTHRSDKVAALAEGKDSCLVIGEKSYEFIPKDQSGYKLPSALFREVAVKETAKSGFYYVYHVKNTDDYYLWASISALPTVTVRDDSGSAIQTMVPDPKDTEYQLVVCYGLLQDFSIKKSADISVEGAAHDETITLAIK